MNKKYIQKNYINLCSPVMGTKIYDYSDQFFGLASRLLKDEHEINLIRIFSDFVNPIAPAFPTL